MEEASIPMTAVCTLHGVYDWIRMPHGLTGAASTFARTVYHALNYLPPEVAIIFQDDCCVMGKNFDEHLENLEKVLEAYESAGFILQIRKSKLFQTEVDFLG